MIPRIKFDIDWLGQLIVNRIPERYIRDPKVKFLDPAIGGGQVVLHLESRVQCAVESRVFGFENEPLYVDYARNINNLKGDYRVVKYEEIISKGFDMRFDVVVGNFPFTENPGQAREASGNSNNSTLYDDFLEISFHTARYISVIIPAGWCKKSVQVKRYLDHGLKSVIFLDAKKVFPDVAIRSGVTVVEFEQDYDGPIEITTTQGNRYSQPRHQPIQDVDPAIKTILGKIDSLGGLSGMIRHGDYEIPKGTKGSLERLLAASSQYREIPDAKHNIPVLLYSGGENRPATWAYSSDKQTSCDAYKVTFPKASDRFILGKVRVLSPGQGVSTALYYIPCKTKKEAEKWRDWLEHPIVNYSLKFHKTNDTVNTYNNAMGHIPKCPENLDPKDLKHLFDFTKDEYARVCS